MQSRQEKKTGSHLLVLLISHLPIPIRSLCNGHTTGAYISRKTHNMCNSVEFMVFFLSIFKHHKTAKNRWMCAHSLTINKNRSAPNKISANHFEVQSFEQSAKTIIKLLAGSGFFPVCVDHQFETVKSANSFWCMNGLDVILYTLVWCCNCNIIIVENDNI